VGDWVISKEEIFYLDFLVELIIDEMDSGLKLETDLAQQIYLEKKPLIIKLYKNVMVDGYKAWYAQKINTSRGVCLYGISEKNRREGFVHYLNGEYKNLDSFIGDIAHKNSDNVLIEYLNFIFYNELKKPLFNCLLKIINQPRIARLYKKAIVVGYTFSRASEQNAIKKNNESFVEELKHCYE